MNKLTQRIELIKRIKSLANSVNEELVNIAENGGFTESKDFDEGYCEGLRQYHLQLIELLEEFKSE